MLAITFIGKSCVGKTKIINRLITNNNIILPSATEKNTSIILNIYDNNNNNHELYLNKELILSSDDCKNIRNKINEINNKFRENNNYDNLTYGYKLYTKIVCIDREYYQDIFFQDTPGLDDEIIKSKLDFFIKKIINSNIIYYIFSFDRLEDEIILFKNVMSIIKKINPNCLKTNIKIIINKIDLIVNKLKDDPELNEKDIIYNHNKLIKNAFKEITNIDYGDPILRISTTDGKYDNDFNILINNINNNVRNCDFINDEYVNSAINKIKSEIIINYNINELNNIILNKIKELYQKYKNIEPEPSKNLNKNINIDKLIFKLIIQDDILIKYPINIVFKIYKENFMTNKLFEHLHGNFVNKFINWWSEHIILQGFLSIFMPNDILYSINNLCFEKNNLENSISYGILNNNDEYEDNLDCYIRYDEMDKYSENNKIFVYNTNEKNDSKIKATIIENVVKFYNPKGEILYEARINNNNYVDEKPKYKS